MVWLQSSIIIVIGFLLSQILITTRSHTKLISYFLAHSPSTTGGLLTATLFTSYGLSVFFSNTVVVLAMLPVVRNMLGLFDEKRNRKVLAALFYCALIFGANTGGMASMTGSPLNVAAAGFADFKAYAGTEHLTFFSWLLVGTPVTFTLLLAARRLLLANIPLYCEPDVSAVPGRQRVDFPQKPLAFFLGNLLLTFILSAFQFLFSPAPVFGQLNTIDLCFLFYLSVFLCVTFIVPRKSLTVVNVMKNLVFLFLFLLAFPLISLSRISEQLETRFALPLGRLHETLDRFQLRMINVFWKFFFGETFSSLSIYNPNSVLSVNRIMLEIPWFGVLLMSVAALLLVLAMSIGNDPSTPEIDGWLFLLFSDITTSVASSAAPPVLLFPAIALSTIFATELLNNTAVLLIVTPAIDALDPTFPSQQLILLLLVALSASGAYMSPFATPVNALAFGGLEKLSIRTLLRLGLVMNLMAALLLSGCFLILSWLV